MKTLKYFLIAALSMMTCTLMTSCKDDANDWDNGGTPTRQWAPTGYSTSAGDTYIEFSQFTVAGATGYVIQVVETDDLTIEPTDETFAAAGVIEKTVGDINSEEVYTFEGLTPETSYNIRLKAVSTGKTDSYWVIVKKNSNGTMMYGATTKKAGESADSDE